MYSPNFTITHKILKHIGEIEAAKAVIDSSPLLPSWEKRFQNDAIARTVHHGTHLEGNPLNLDQTKKVIEGEEIYARERDIQEVINYRNVVDFIGKTKNVKFTENLMQILHRLTTEKTLPDDKIGKYRTTSVVVRNSKTGEITFRPPPAIEVPYLLRSFFSWLNFKQSLHPVIKAAIVHYEIARIHPFVDGNGRVARALSTLVLFVEGYDIRRFFSLEEYYDKNAKAYYKALQAVSTINRQAGENRLPDNLIRKANLKARMQAYQVSSPNLTPWLEYFIEGFAQEFNRIKQRVQKISRDFSFKATLGGQVYLNDRQLKIVEYIQEFGFLQNKSFSRLFPNLSEDTILRELKDLSNKNIIKKKGKTKAARYILA